MSWVAVQKHKVEKRMKSPYKPKKVKPGTELQYDDTGKSGFCIAWRDSLADHVFRIVFARLEDANIAAASANELTKECCTTQAVVDKIADIGPKEFARLVIQDLRW